MTKAKYRVLLTILISAFFPAAWDRIPQKSGGAGEVTIYVSTDRVFSEHILRGYEQKTGVKVNVVYDTEETKSTGLANRLLAEKGNPQADVFWSNESVRTLVLKSRGVLSPYKSPGTAGIPSEFKDAEGYWTGFSAHLPVIVYKVQADRGQDLRLRRAACGSCGTREWTWWYRRQRGRARSWQRRRL
jgi:ABC-type thiamine transport system substrate-binding protein